MIIRPAQAEDVPTIARVHVDSWRTTYSGIVNSQFLASLSYEARERMWVDALSSSTNQAFIHVAEVPEAGVVGFAAAGPVREHDEQYKGEVYALYLLKEHQRQGIGRALFGVSAGELQCRGVTSFLVWVLKANPACRFYEALGGRYLREKEIKVGQERLLEIAYRWNDMGAISGT